MQIASGCTTYSALEAKDPMMPLPYPYKEKKLQSFSLQWIGWTHDMMHPIIAPPSISPATSTRGVRGLSYAHSTALLVARIVTTDEWE